MNGGRARRRRRRAVGREQLGLDARRLDPGGDQRGAALLDHAERAAQEIAVDVVRRSDGPREQRDPLAVEAAVQDVDVLRLARQHVKDGQPAEMPVLQLFERAPEHDARRRAVAVEQRGARFRVGGEHGADDRDDRRDAGAGGEEGVMPARADLRGEAAFRSGDVEAAARPQRLVGEAGEAAALDLPDRDPQLASRPSPSRSNRSAGTPRRRWSRATSDTARAGRRIPRASASGTAKASDTLSGVSWRRSAISSEWKRLKEPLRRI